MMDQNNWVSFHPDKSDFYDLNEGILDIKNDGELKNEVDMKNEPFLFNQLEQNLYENLKLVDLHNPDLQDPNSHGNGNQPINEDPLNRLNDFLLDNYNFDLNGVVKMSNDDLNYDGSSGGTPDHREEHRTNPQPHNNSSAFPPTTSSVQNTPNMGPYKTQQHHHLQDKHVMNSPILPSQNDKSFNKQHYYHKILRSKSKETIEHMPQLQHIRPDVVFTPLMSPHTTPNDLKTPGKYPIQAAFEPLTSPALRAQNNQNNQSTGNGFNDKRRSLLLVFSTVDENRPVNFKRKTPHGTPILQTNNEANHQNSNFERLPEASMSTSDSSTPMLPPQSYKKIDPESNSTSPQMMGFTMGKLAKQQQLHLGQSSQGSPQISSRKSSFASTRSNETSPNLGPLGKGEKPPSKKASHKLAEQGRRNRMNSAVHSLGLLIPQSYHDTVAIPSKATTVELAANYIQDLLEEIDTLKKK